MSWRHILTSAKPSGEKTLDELIRDLESQVDRLEEGKLTVDESIKAYMEGMNTAIKCKSMLDAMNQKVTLAREKARRAMEDVKVQDDSDNADPQSKQDDEVPW